MNDDQTFDVGKVEVLYSKFRQMPTIGQIWTDPATGQEVMVVPLDSLLELSDGFYKSFHAMLASLRTKDTPE